MTEKLLTTHDVAARLEVEEEEVSRLVKAGKISAIRIAGELLRFHPEDIDAYQYATRTATHVPEISRHHPRPVRVSVSEPEGVGENSWWESVLDFFYTYDFYFVCTGLTAGMVVAIFWSP